VPEPSHRIISGGIPHADGPRHPSTTILARADERNTAIARTGIGETDIFTDVEPR